MKAFSIYAALCLCCLFLPVPPESAGFYTGAPFYTNFTYMFFHAGAFHLILNAAALFFLFRSGKYGFRALIAAMMTAFIAALLSPLERPTVGASGVVYAILAFHAVKVMLENRKAAIPLMLAALIALAAGFFRPATNALVHLTAYTIGFAAYLIYSVISEKANEKANEKNRN